MIEVETEKFKGPLDLLLELIENEKLDICQISLATITDKYLSEISKIERDGSEMAEFLVVAAKLLYIKSKQLLPSLETAEEEEEIAELEARLAEYQRYKRAAERLSEILDEGGRGFRRKAKNERIITFLPPENLTKGNLFAIFEEIFKEMPSEPEKVIETKKISLEEKRDDILKQIKSKKKISFSGILKQAGSKMEVIVTFLAILEMIKQSEIKVSQTKNFADFKIEGVK
jgi:segregation and condensation protein A